MLSRQTVYYNNLHNYSYSFNLFTQDSFFKNYWPNCYYIKSLRS